MKKRILLLALLISAFSYGQTTVHRTKVRIEKVNELVSKPITTKLMVLDPANNEVKYVTIDDLPKGLQETDINTFAKLDAIVADKRLANLDDAQIFTKTQTFNTGNTDDNIYSVNTSNGKGIYSVNESTGIGIVANGSTDSEGYVFAGQNSGQNTFTVTKEGDVVANTYNGVILKNNGLATNFLNEQGNYISINTNPEWGNITGALSNQTDLQTALDNKNPLIPHLSFNNAEKTIWNTGKGITGNTAFGRSALINVTTALQNSAFGTFSLKENISGNFNSAFGNYALEKNTSGSNNSAFGREALYLNSYGTNNSAFGANSLKNNISGTGNSAFGSDALLSRGSGSGNTAIGGSALKNLTSGNSNIAIGHYSGAYFLNTNSNLTTASNSVFLGKDAKALSDNQTNEIVIGYSALGNGSNSVTLGNDQITNTYLKGVINGDGSGLTNLPTETPTEILNKIKTVDGTGSGLDADLLRGMHWGNISTNVSLQDNVRLQFGSTPLADFRGFGNEISLNFYGNKDFIIRRNATQVTKITSGGNATFAGTVTATSFNPSSDENLKTELKAITPEDFVKIPLSKYHLKTDLERLRYGVGARELEKTHPELVYTNEDDVKSVSYFDLLILKSAEYEHRIKELELKQTEQAVLIGLLEARLTQLENK